MSEPEWGCSLQTRENQEELLVWGEDGQTDAEPEFPSGALGLRHGERRRGPDPAIGGRCGGAAAAAAAGCWEVGALRQAAGWSL